MLREQFALLRVSSKDLKMLREQLCMMQSVYSDPENLRRIQVLINQIDIYRPLGSDGKHDNLHTPTCGCDDIE
jgi:hypothetical protein